MVLSKSIAQVVHYATVSKQLQAALQALFDECVIADMSGDLSDAITGETLDKVREALKAAEHPRALDGLVRCKKCNALIETTVHCDSCGTFEPTRQ